MLPARPADARTFDPLALLRPPPPLPSLTDEPERQRRHAGWQWRIFLSVTVGYGLYYTTRLPLSVAKKPLLDAGVLDAGQLGQVGSALLGTYAVGKAINGFLGDRVHLKRFFLLGLCGAALATLAFGLSSAFPLFLLFFAVNGWFQSIGATTSGITLAAWFPPSALGTRYGIWSVSHNLGEALTFAVTAALVDQHGWRAGFVAPALLCLSAALVLARTTADRPRSLGLAPTGETHEERVAPTESQLAALQRGVLKNPLVWTLALASACMYVTRYALNNWGVLLLQTEKGQTLPEAGRSLSLFPLIGAVGSVAVGVASDRLFGGRRGVPALLCGVLCCAALTAVLYLPGEERLLLRVALSAVGFAIGGQLVLLGGLSAMERADPRAAGAALGIVGGVSYVGASLQDLASGALIRRLPGGGHDFSAVKPLWLAAGALALLLSVPLWLAERRRRMLG